MFETLLVGYGIETIMNRILFFILALFANQATAQLRNVSVIHDNLMFNYTITRYSPAWEIQSGEADKSAPLASEHSKLIRKVDDANLQNLKSLLYTKGFVPGGVDKMDGKSMEAYLAKNKLVMHYRIRFRDHTIFLAHLNNSPTRSVIPFFIDGGRWILDPGFAETDLFKLLSMPYYNAFTGTFEGQPICDLSFEEIGNNGTVYDYSGKGNDAEVQRVSISNGRIGGAVKVGPESKLSIDLRNEKELSGNHFTVDFHLNVQNVSISKNDELGILAFNSESGRNLHVAYKNGELIIRALGSPVLHTPLTLDSWAHISIVQNNKKLALLVDGVEVDSQTCEASNVLFGTLVSVGGIGSFKGLLDELRICK